LIDTCVWCIAEPGRDAFYRSGHGLVLVFKSGTAAHVDNINVDTCGRNRSNVWPYPAIKGSRLGRKSRSGRATNVPVALAADIIKDASGRGEVVLAAFVGADAVLLAAEETGRRAVVIDDDPRRIDAAIRRWHSLTGNAAVAEDTGETFAARSALPGAACGRPLNTGE
jgi:DNA modification methylase